MKLTKPYVIILLFIVYSVLTYLIMSLLIQHQIDENEVKDSGILDTVLSDVYKIIFGVISYFVLINSSSIVGLIISIKRKDTLATQAFKTITMLTAIATFLYFICI